MRKIILPLALGASMALSGCTSLGGGGLLGDIFGDDTYGYNGGSEFERRAAQVCGQQANRYGRVSIDRVEQRDRDYVYVYGRIDSRDYNRDEFVCVVRSDGRVVDFQTR